MIVSLFIVGVTLLGMFTAIPAYAQTPDGISGVCNNEKGAVDIVIEHPKGWKTKSTDILIKVVPEKGIKIDKIEARIERSGGYENITEHYEDEYTFVTISENSTIYIQVTDKNGDIYTANRYIECFDRDAPTVKAYLNGTLVRIEADDTISGVEGIFVNGYKFTTLTNDTLDIRLQETDTYFELVSIQAIDFAGNKSAVYNLKNPFFIDPAKADDKKADNKKEDTKEKTENTKEDLKPTEPTSAKGTVTQDKQNGGGSTVSSAPPTDTVSNAQPTATENPKEFYTIVTKNEKVFYLIVDKEKSSENVYLLTEVSENDLLNFTDYEYVEPEPETEPNIEYVIPEPEKEVEPEPDNEPEPEKKGNSSGLLIFVLILVAGAGGAYYYFKIYKPNAELGMMDDEDFGDDEYEDEYDFEDSVFSSDYDDSFHSADTKGLLDSQNDHDYDVEDVDSDQ